MKGHSVRCQVLEWCLGGLEGLCEGWCRQGIGQQAGSPFPGWSLPVAIQTLQGLQKIRPFVCCVDSMLK